MMEKWSSEELHARYEALEDNIKAVRFNIAEAAIQAGRKPEEVRLLAATKTVPAEVVNRAMALGIDLIGENRVQELNSKWDELHREQTEIHLIGHLQTNKVAAVTGKVAMIESIDSIRLARAVSERSLALSICTPVLVEVNIGEEESKSGIRAQELEEFLGEISGFPGISVRGIMSIPPICDTKAEIRQIFYRLHKLFVDIRGKRIDNVSMDVLSMGMSGDYAEAVAEGATLVRVGSALFGPRQSH